jgi:hypothetical protein
LIKFGALRLTYLEISEKQPFDIIPDDPRSWKGFPLYAKLTEKTVQSGFL